MPEERGLLRIVLIEDNQDHAKILRWAFERTSPKTQLLFFQDAESALAHLRSNGEDPALVPDLIFLDFNLPKVDGREMLRLLKASKISKDVPVIVLSSSERDEDVRNAYRLGASTYISKSVILNELSDSLQSVLDYWLRLAKLPDRGYHG
ncbi:MAG: response regulator [Ignavibacteriales bacterium]|nr:response regulator [Ignavibacteriales bacterium]